MDEPRVPVAGAFDAPRKIAKLLADFHCRWAFAGGWAIDLYLGRETREHKDVDVAVLRRDQGAIWSYLSVRGWSLEKALHRELFPWNEGERLELPIHVLWCRNGAYDPDFLELVLNEATATDFLFRRDQSLTMPLDRAFVTAASGLPILAPEVALLYKAKWMEEPGNADDFRSALPALDPAARAWLLESIAKLYPDHPTLDSM